MDPVSLLAVGSSLFGAFGQIRQGQAASAAAKYQAGVARNNQIIADQNARYAVAAGESQAQAQDFKNRALVGAIEAAQGASGISLDSPTLADVRAGESQIGRLDTATIMQRALLQERSYEQEASNFGAQSTFAEAEGRSAKRAGYIGAAGSILGGASNFADKWQRFKLAGVPGYAS